MKSRRGFATIIALVSLTLVGVTLAGLMQHFSSQAIRATAEGNRAQLQQLQIAGSLAGTSKLTLPTELSNAKARLVVEIHGKQRWIDAEFAGRRERLQR